jgi:iron(III) transport system substrate-binding protein
VEWVGSPHAQLLAAREMMRNPARHDLPDDSLPEWVRVVNRDMKVADLDWAMLSEKSADWMTYWDRTVRGKGQAAAAR